MDLVKLIEDAKKLTTALGSFTSHGTGNFAQMHNGSDGSSLFSISKTS